MAFNWDNLYTKPQNSWKDLNLINNPISNAMGNVPSGSAQSQAQGSWGQKLGQTSGLISSLGSLVGKGGSGMLGTAGKILGGASAFLGPAAMGLQIGGMLYGAWDKAKQAKKQIKSLDKKTTLINKNMGINENMIKSGLETVDKEAQRGYGINAANNMLA